jgi:Type I phosphodiesterase / nucleotide pyrophosphatase
MREGELGPRQRHSAPLYSPPPRVYCWRGLAATAPQLLGIVGILWTRSQFIRCRHLIALIALSALLSACATRYEVAQDYSELVRRDERPTSSQTVIVFLIDGLQLGMLKEELTNGQLPALSTYFLSGQDSVHTARTVFPSLTYPAISSLLTGLPVEGTA